MADQLAPNVNFATQPGAQPAPTDWLSFLTGEILAAGLLSKALYSFPSREWLEALAADEVFSDAPLGEAQPDVQAGLKLLQAWTESVRGGLSDAALDDIRVDYTRLMIGPERVLAPPWESVYFSDERLIFSERTSQVRGWYEHFGVAVEKRQQEPDDHIGLELAFITHLARAALMALERSDAAVFENLIAAQREFLAQHLLTWVGDWCGLVSMHTHTDYYRGIGLLVSGVLTEIATVFTLPPPQPRRQVS